MGLPQAPGFCPCHAFMLGLGQDRQQDQSPCLCFTPPNGGGKYPEGRDCTGPRTGGTFLKEPFTRACARHKGLLPPHHAAGGLPQRLQLSPAFLSFPFVKHLGGGGLPRPRSDRCSPACSLQRPGCLGVGPTWLVNSLESSLSSRAPQVPFTCRAGWKSMPQTLGASSVRGPGIMEREGWHRCACGLAGNSLTRVAAPTDLRQHLQPRLARSGPQQTRLRG